MVAKSDDNIELEWCYQHKLWFSTHDECPECKAERTKDIADKIILDLQQKIDEQENIIFELTTELKSRGDE